MNVNDYQIEIPQGDMLETIFSHQRHLMNEYHTIEETNVGHRIVSSPCVHGPFCGVLNINDRASQLRMKDFAWRITEELTEATLAIGEEDKTHYLEELIDALHFSVELLIMCGFEPENLVFGLRMEGDFFSMAFNQSEHCFYDMKSPQMNATNNLVAYMAIRRRLSFEVIEKLGDAMNRLKLKPWKTTGMMTDEAAFKISMIQFFKSLIDLLKASGFTAKTATQMYLNKNAVNQFRIGSNY